MKERRLLRKTWQKADENEKEGLKVLWDQIRSRLATLRRAERIQKRRGKKEGPFQICQKPVGREKKWEAGSPRRSLRIT